MATWGEVAHSNRTAALQLFEVKAWRSCISRAYYATYSCVTDALVNLPIAMPGGREGPQHLPLPNIAGNNLTNLKIEHRWRLSGTVKKLYDLRCIADYRPSVTVDEDEARITLGLMKQAFDLLRDAK